jgi:hypothetical protein
MFDLFDLALQNITGADLHDISPPFVKPNFSSNFFFKKEKVDKKK